MLYRAFISALFFFFKDPETVHHAALAFLRVLGLPPFSWAARFVTRVEDSALSQNIFGVTFKNPVGLAAGFEKKGEAIPGLEALGFGFLELGTISPTPQPGNPRQRIFRYGKHGAVVNRMGFGNIGVDAFLDNLARSAATTIPLGISIVKSKETELKDAAADYRLLFEKLYARADFFVVNVSSPNMTGLRELQEKKMLLDILSVLNRYRDKQEARKPILVKIAPDLDNEGIDDVIAVCRAERVDGIIATNTTVSREAVPEAKGEPGGLSGKPLRARSTEIIRYIHSKYPALPIIGLGGVFSAADAYEKIRAGASLVQIYTGFIYEGPLAVRNINQGLVKLLARDGFKNISEAVGH